MRERISRIMITDARAVEACEAGERKGRLFCSGLRLFRLGGCILTLDVRQTTAALLDFIVLLAHRCFTLNAVMRLLSCGI
jgi:hypothetical protein